jgi:hypothetical protein
MTILSKHAQTRCQQRGIPKHVVKLLIDHADIERPVGGGCSMLRVSRRQASAIKTDKLARFALIWSNTQQQVVSVFPVHSSGAGRRYGNKN